MRTPQMSRPFRSNKSEFRQGRFSTPPWHQIRLERRSQVLSFSWMQSLANLCGQHGRAGWAPVYRRDISPRRILSCAPCLFCW
jgi:hypothetical protein